MLRTSRYALTACAGLCLLAASSLRAQFSYDFPKPRRTDTGVTARAADRANSAGLGRKVVRIKAEGVPASVVFLAIAEKAGMRVGVELTRLAQHPTLVSLDIAGGNVMDAFDKVVRADQTYLLRSAGSGYENYYPREYQTRDTREVTDTSAPYVPRRYVFTTKLSTIDFAGVSPEKAIGDLLSREDVRTKSPRLPIEILPSGKASTTKQLRFGTRDIRVRQAVNVIAGTAGASWIAYIPTHIEGKAKVRVQLYSKAVEVCPEASKVSVELE